MVVLAYAQRDQAKLRRGTGKVHARDADCTLWILFLRLLMQALSLFVSIIGAAHGALELTPSNFDSSIAGKSAFIKFLAPW